MTLLTFLSLFKLYCSNINFAVLQKHNNNDLIAKTKQTNVLSRDRLSHFTSSHLTRHVSHSVKSRMTFNNNNNADGR